ncbi:uncharacterized protein ARMOST_04169 [Armillaria ostoyae]|uniref:Uncharacterized protein n=1 Tax=Armillaria ostoyae TaxID=47428 RepID=A0A284QWL2_ARMOS|nr:uncharacterized protein ARMOST_04169 [Armillaria ostoyae]
MHSSSSKRNRSPDFTLGENSVTPESKSDSDFAIPAKRRKTGSPKSQTLVTPSSAQSPKVTKKALAEALKAQKEQQRRAWDAWLARDENQWSPDKDPEYKQKVGWKVIHFTVAKTYYRFSDKEMGTLPYTTFENQHNTSRPGRAFNRSDLLRLGYRKEAALSGVKGALEGTFEGGALHEGKKLFDAKLEHLNDKYKKAHQGQPRPGPRTLNIVLKTETSDFRRPFGSWWERVWDPSGNLAGWWLVMQFDPGASDSSGPSDEERFWPIEQGHPPW